MAGPGTKLSRRGAHLASCATKFARRGAFTVVSAKKLARRGAFTGSPATKFAQRSPYYGVFAKKLARQAIKRHFWGIFRALGELFRAHTHHQTKQGELCTARGAGVGTKLSRLAASASPTGTKLSQHAPKRRFRPTFRTQGEFYTASTTNKPSREKKVTRQHPASPQQHTPPPISHVIRLHEISTTPRNVAIPTNTIQILK